MLQIWIYGNVFCIISYNKKSFNPDYNFNNYIERSIYKIEYDCKLKKLIDNKQNKNNKLISIIAEYILKYLEIFARKNKDIVLSTAKVINYMYFDKLIYYIHCILKNKIEKDYDTDYHFLRDAKQVFYHLFNVLPDNRVSRFIKADIYRIEGNHKDMFSVLEYDPHPYSYLLIAKYYESKMYDTNTDYSANKILINKYYKLASQASSSQATYILALHYYNLQCNKSIALDYYKLAAFNGHNKSISALKFHIGEKQYFQLISGWGILILIIACKRRRKELFLPNELYELIFNNFL